MPQGSWHLVKVFTPFTHSLSVVFPAQGLSPSQRTASARRWPPRRDAGCEGEQRDRSMLSMVLSFIVWVL